jgi:aryl-alcohol dehydrogenase-like predicted oxidoreductase
MLEGKYTADTVFPENDHRRHRPRSWLVNGVQKVKTLDFLEQGMTLGQASLKWLLAEPLVVTTLPNIYDQAQLDEFAAASDAPDLSAEAMERVHALDAVNFGIEEDAMKYKGAMTRSEGANTDLQDARNPISRPAVPAHHDA